MSMRVAVGSDHAGFDLKEILRAELAALGHDVADLGTHDGDHLGRLPRLRRGRRPGGGRRAGRPRRLRLRQRQRHRHGGQQGAGRPGRRRARRHHGHPGPAAQPRQRRLPRRTHDRGHGRRRRVGAFLDAPSSRRRPKSTVATTAASRSWPPSTASGRPTENSSTSPHPKGLHEHLRRRAGRRSRGRRSHRPGAGPPADDAAADRVGELHLAGRPGRDRLGAHQQVRGGLSGPALLRGQPDHRRGRGPGPRPCQVALRRRRTPTCSRTPAPTPTWPSTRPSSSRAPPSWPCASTTAGT